MASSRALLAAAITTAALVALLAASAGRRAADTPAVPESHAIELAAGHAVTPPAPLPDLSLLDQQGRPFTQANLGKRWTLVFPGFTHCPDICPATLAILAQVHELLGSRASELQVVLLTVDPQRDTPAALADYLAFFNPDFIGVTGEQAQLERAYQGLGVQHIRIPGAGGDYSVDHSAALLLVDPLGRLVAYFMPPFRAEHLARDLGPLLAVDGAADGGAG